MLVSSFKAGWTPYYLPKNRPFRTTVRLDGAATLLCCSVFRDEGEITETESQKLPTAAATAAQLGHSR